jgi:hypothetical protein
VGPLLVAARLQPIYGYGYRYRRDDDDGPRYYRRPYGYYGGQRYWGGHHGWHRGWDDDDD